MSDQHMVYEEVELMAHLFLGAEGELQSLITDLIGISAMLDDGGLIGDAGDEFSESLRSKLVPSIRRMADKFKEEAKDLMGAVEYMRDGVDTAESKFI